MGYRDRGGLSVGATLKLSTREGRDEGPGWGEKSIPGGRNTLCKGPGVLLHSPQRGNLNGRCLFH